MSIASIKLDFLCGCTIRESFEEAVRISTLLNVNTVFDTNDVYTLVFPNADVDELMSEYERVLTNDKMTYKVVCGAPKGDL